jgi:hypothetical protein
MHQRREQETGFSSRQSMPETAGIDGQNNRPNQQKPLGE